MIRSKLRPPDDHDPAALLTSKYYHSIGSQVLGSWSAAHVADYDDDVEAKCFFFSPDQTPER